MVAPTPRVPAGQQLDRDAVRALCLARDLGKAAAAGAESHPLLVGVPRTDWPRLVEEGRLAIADLVESVRPIAHVTMRGRRRNDDGPDRRRENRFDRGRDSKSIRRVERTALGSA